MTTMLFHAVTGLLGYVYVTALEWGIHRYLFHELGRRKGSRFQFHYVDHHRASRRHAGADPAFSGSRLVWNGYGREFWGIIALGLLHLPIVLVAPAFYAVAALAGLNYHRVHTKAHRDPEWMRTHLRSHWDHHMGNADASDGNWCVTSDWFDRLMGTRVEWTAPDERAQDQTPLAAR